MQTELMNSAGVVCMTTEHDAVQQWICNNWLGDLMYASVVAGAEVCLELLPKYKCFYLLSNNCQVSVPCWNGHCRQPLIYSC